MVLKNKKNKESNTSDQSIQNLNIIQDNVDNPENSQFYHYDIFKEKVKEEHDLVFFITFLLKIIGGSVIAIFVSFLVVPSQKASAATPPSRNTTMGERSPTKVTSSQGVQFPIGEVSPAKAVFIQPVLSRKSSMVKHSKIMRSQATIMRAQATQSKSLPVHAFSTLKVPVQRAKMFPSRLRSNSTNQSSKNKKGLSLSSFISKTRTMPLRKQKRLRLLRKKFIRVKLEDQSSPNTDDQSQNKNPQYLLLKKEYVTKHKKKKKREKNWVNIAVGFTFVVVNSRHRAILLDPYIASAICVHMKCQIIKWQAWLPLFLPHFQQTIRLQRSIRHFGYTILSSSKKMLIDEKTIVFYAAFAQIAENLFNIRQTTLEEFGKWLQSDINTKINSKILMVMRSDFQKKQDNILANISEHKSLEPLVRDATIRDIKSLLQRVDGSSNRFETLETLWNNEAIEDLETAFFSGIPQSIYDYMWATLYLSTWDPELPISAGMPQSMQRFLDRTSPFMNNLNLALSRISILEKASSSNPLGLGLGGLLRRKKRSPKAEQLFSQLKIWARAVPLVRTRMVNISTESPLEKESFWKLKEREFIPACFCQARQICQNEMGIHLAEDAFQDLVKNFIDLAHEDFL